MKRTGFVKAGIALARKNYGDATGAGHDFADGMMEAFEDQDGTTIPVSPWNLQISGRPNELRESSRVPATGEYLSIYDAEGVAEFYRVTRVVWSARGSSSFIAIVYAVVAQP